MIGASAAWAAELPPLGAEVLEALGGLPNGDQLPLQRERLLPQHHRFAESMRHVEAADIDPRALAELWLWLVHLHVDRGYRVATTVQEYSRLVGRFLAWCRESDIDFAAAQVRDFDRWQQWLALERKNGLSYRGSQLSAVKNFYGWRVARGIARKDPTAALERPRVRPKPAKKYTDEQLRALFRTLGEERTPKAIRDRCVLLLLLATGMRREELKTLTLGQLEVGKRTAVVRIHGKGSKERDVPFEGPAVLALQDWLATRDGLDCQLDPDAVFVSVRNGRSGGVGQAMALRSFEAMIANRARAAGLRDWGIHRFRVTFATQLFDDGVDIETIRALMGHESIETTRRYLAVSERARRTRLSANRQHRVLGTRPNDRPLWTRLVTGDLSDG